MKNALQFRVGLINKILSEVIFIKVNHAPWKCFRGGMVLLLCRDALLIP
jgi:hypothetical protein